MSAVQPLSGGVIRFGLFEVDLRAGELRKQGVKVKLQEQPFQILQVLLEHPGELVTREQLRQRIWPADTFVDFDHGLYNAIKRLREALGDSAENPRYIETLSRRGYRFIGLLNAVSPASLPFRNSPRIETAPQSDQASQPTLAEEPTSLAATHRRSAAFRVLTALVLLILGAAALLGLARVGWKRTASDKSDARAIKSVAVLPLQSLSSDPAQEYFAEGVTDALITDLAQISALKVVSRTSVRQYRDTNKPLPQIARELNVDGIVEGTVQRSGDRVRITAQLIYGAADEHVWANSFERSVEDILALQSTVAAEIAGAIKVKVTPAEQSRLKHVRAVNPKALDAYVNARFHLEQANNADLRKGKLPLMKQELDKGVFYLDLAVQQDPAYVPAYLAYLGAIGGGACTPMQLRYFPKAKAALLKALELDETDVAAHIAMGNLLSQFEFDWDGAGREFRRAIEISPNSGDAHGAYAEYLGEIGDKAGHDKELSLAQSLNPSHDYYADVGVSRAGYTLEQQRQALEEKAPYDGFLMGNLARNYAQAGRFKEAVEMWSRALDAYGWHQFAEVLRRADAKGGPRFALEEWMRACERYSKTHDDLPVFVPAFTYSSLGDKDHAFAWLEKAYAGRNWTMLYLKEDGVWDPLRSDPRFNNLLERVGLLR